MNRDEFNPGHLVLSHEFEKSIFYYGKHKDRYDVIVKKSGEYYIYSVTFRGTEFLETQGSTDNRTAREILSEYLKTLA